MSRKLIVVAGAVFSLALWGVLASNGSSAAPSTAEAERVTAGHSWPSGSEMSARRGLREARAAARADGGSVLVLIERTLRSADIDVGNPGESAGDYFVFESALFTPAGERAGRDSVRCTLGIRTFICDATFQVTGWGKLTAYGAFFGNEPQIAVTGGTRRFLDAGGQLLPLEGPGGSTRLVFQLTD